MRQKAAQNQPKRLNLKDRDAVLPGVVVDTATVHYIRHMTFGLAEMAKDDPKLHMLVYFLRLAHAEAALQAHNEEKHL